MPINLSLCVHTPATYTVSEHTQTEQHFLPKCSNFDCCKTLTSIVEMEHAKNRIWTHHSNIDVTISDHSNCILMVIDILTMHPSVMHTPTINWKINFNYDFCYISCTMEANGKSTTNKARLRFRRAVDAIPKKLKLKYLDHYWLISSLISNRKHDFISNKIDRYTSNLCNR